MTSQSQIDANRLNAARSTGPVTESGKAASSRNALSLGLFTRQDYVKPEERDIYKEFSETMYSELCPQGLLEETLTSEITGASWRLRRCSNVEGELADYQPADPMSDEKNHKLIRSIERARSSAHSMLHRSIDQLRKLQTDRFSRQACNADAPDAGLSDFRQVTTAFNNYEKAMTRAKDNRLASICNEPSQAPQIARNALCPCRSGQKYKRCCGKNAPPVLGKAA